MSLQTRSAFCHHQNAAVSPPLELFRTPSKIVMRQCCSFVGRSVGPRSAGITARRPPTVQKEVAVKSSERQVTTGGGGGGVAKLLSSQPQKAIVVTLTSTDDFDGDGLVVVLGRKKKHNFFWLLSLSYVSTQLVSQSSLGAPHL